LDLAAELIRLDHEVHLVYSPIRAAGWFENSAAEITSLQVYRVKMSRKPGLRDIGACFQLRRLLRQLGPFDIIHGHSSKGGALIRLAARGFGAKLVYTPHAFITLDPTLNPVKRTIFGIAERVLAKLGHGVICVSEEERDHAMTLGIRPDQCFIVHNGLAPMKHADREEIRRQWGVEPDAVCAGFVGRLSHQKAVERLIEAFTVIYAHHQRLHLVIVGDGPNLDSVKRLTEELGITNRTIFTGTANGAAQMAGLDLYVMASLYEAFPYALLEAASRGLPIVATAVGGAKAVVKNGVSGFVVPQDRMDEFAGHMGELTSDIDARRNMARESRKIAGRFTVERMAEQTIGVYTALLADS
jgi:glycosyltransferase involved in cell wall biosynthesis